MTDGWVAASKLGTDLSDIDYEDESEESSEEENLHSSRSTTPFDYRGSFSSFLCPPKQTFIRGINGSTSTERGQRQQRSSTGPCGAETIQITASRKDIDVWRRSGKSY
jgi:hypothetical protein